MSDEKDIVVITHGRFHSFDLAEQLQAAGRLAAIYTGYPRFKVRNTKIDPALIRSFPWITAPYLALARVSHVPRALLREAAWYAGYSLSRYAAKTLPDCRLVTALSGGGLEAGTEIKRRGGAYVCDRGSTHIAWADRILEQEYGLLDMPWEPIDRRAVAKEHLEYDLADAITLPSRFTVRTFIEMGVPADKLRLVPYGVNIDIFRPSAARAQNFRILFVGGLSVRKGLHYLLQAFSRAKLPGAELILVGGRTPDTEILLKRFSVDGVTWRGAVSREQVAHEMSQASVMVLPSVEEGLALVQAQALACGCPVIATTSTGSEDLYESGKEGFIVAPRDVDALVEKLTVLYRDKELREAMASAARERVKNMGGWSNYGTLMLAVFDELLSKLDGRVMTR